MAASIPAPLSFKEKLLIIFALFSLIIWHVPVVGAAYAKAEDINKSEIFEIKTETALTDADLEKQKAQQLAFEQINRKVSLLRDYLEKKNSPLAIYSEYLIAQDDWKTIIAVSNSESGMGKHCYLNNCSGIFGYNGLRTYKTIPDWIADMQQLINQRYKGMSLTQMDGIYVQPRSESWLYASTSVYEDLNQLEKQFDIQNTDGSNA